jgi:hypothetical protein
MNKEELTKQKTALHGYLVGIIAAKVSAEAKVKELEGQQSYLQGQIDLITDFLKSE